MPPPFYLMAKFNSTSDNRQEIYFYYNRNDIAGLNQLIDTIIAKAS